MSNIVLNTLTYVGDGIQNGIAVFTERTAGMVGFFKKLTSSVTLKKDRSIVKWKLVIPFPATAPTDCPCPGASPYLDTIADITVRMDPRTTTADRDDVQKQIKDLVATAQFISTVKDLTLSP